MAAKKARKQGGRIATGKVRKCYHLSAETARKVALAAANEERNESDLVEEALSAKYSGVYMIDRNAPAAVRGGVKLATELDPTADPSRIDHQAA
jgi:hypothetical protein